MCIPFGIPVPPDYQVVLLSNLLVVVFKYRQSSILRIRTVLPFFAGSGWLNELGSWITLQLIDAYHQYDVGSRPAL